MRQNLVWQFKIQIPSLVFSSGNIFHRTHFREYVSDRIFHVCYLLYKLLVSVHIDVGSDDQNYTYQGSGIDHHTFCDHRNVPRGNLDRNVQSKQNRNSFQVGTVLARASTEL